MKRIIFTICQKFLDKLRKGYANSIKKKLGYCGKNVRLSFPEACQKPQHVYLHDNTNIFEGFKFISKNGKFIMKKNSGAAQGLTVITGFHNRVLSHSLEETMSDNVNNGDKDVIVEEDVWIGANVTLCAGVTVGRGCNVGAGSVVRKNLPPYAIVIGNPAKVIGFCFTPEEIIEHENALYPKEERIPIEILERNYKKYFKEHYKDILNYTSIICR